MEEELFTADFPAGEGAGGFADVVFAVVTDAEAEELHQLASVVLVRFPLLVDDGVEPDHHRRVLGDLLQHWAELAEGVPTKELVLPEHRPDVLNFGVAG